jgi:hypothetical protein
VGLLVASIPLVTANGHSDILHRDVVVIGGGASGAYAAVRLRDDLNKSIALIEKQDILVSSPIYLPAKFWVIEPASGLNRPPKNAN